LNDLAVEYALAGKAAEAVPLLERVRDRRVQQLGEDHDDTLATLESLASAYRQAGKKAEAIALAEKVLEARVKKHGDDHPQAIAAMESLAFTYQACYRMPQAFALYKEARDNTVPKLGDYHPLTLKILHGLAHMHWAYRELPEAIALFEQVRERQVVILGGYHPVTLVTLNGLALAYKEAGEPHKALALFEQAAAGVERLAYAHNDAHRIIFNLANCHELLEQYEQAEAWRRKWAAVAKVKYGPESLTYAGRDGLTGLGANLLRQKKYADAEPILRESLAVLEKNHPDVWDASYTRALLGWSLLGEQRYAAAESYLVQGFQDMKKMERDSGGRFAAASARRHLTEALERVVQLYESTKNPDEAAKWRKELDALRKDTEALTAPNDK
jgi:tetratricopeptide (TPR) repeat protein